MRDTCLPARSSVVPPSRRYCAPSFYRSKLQCVACPSLTAVYLAAFVVAVVLVGAFAGWMHKKQYNLQVSAARSPGGTHARPCAQGLTIGIDLLQVRVRLPACAGADVLTP